MSRPQVTIAVVPRERFDMAVPSLESVIAHTGTPYDLVYVDGNSPGPVQRRVRSLVVLNGCRLVRSTRYPSPNRARNLALDHVRTEYVCFVDNDLFVTEGWLDALLACARDTGAWAVGPLYLEGEPADQVIHMAGGDIELSGDHGSRSFATNHRLHGARIDDLTSHLERERVDFVELHCVLVRTDALTGPGRLDESLYSTREHLGLCLAIGRRGGEVWFEPAAVVASPASRPVRLRDLAYFWLRWSEAWNATSLERFSAKHGIDPRDRGRAVVVRDRRQVILDPVRAWCAERSASGPTRSRRSCWSAPSSS